MADQQEYDFDREDPLEHLLDEESDSEFGLPEFREHLADTLTPAVLKDWTAKDFASIYVRFRPHLERHAKRYLRNSSQVEEVVQDAFLYLMTTLPELDSELGVLRFLKWKTRLLALDVIRSNSRASFAPLDEQPEFAADLPDSSDGLERADDAAIVSLALAKLQPRHREALLATMYEEKSNEVVAAQMGLSDNAFRQLLFRARSAFKKSLVGEAEIAGKSMAEVLSIAARKAAKDSGKVLGAAGAFLLVLAISIGALPGFLTPTPAEQIAEPQVQQPAPAGESPAVVPAPEVATPQPEEVVVEVVAELSGESPVIVPAVVANDDSSSKKDQETEALLASMRPLLGLSSLQKLGSLSVGQVESATVDQLVISNGSGLTAYLAYDLLSANGIQFVSFKIVSGGNEFMATPKSWIATKRSDNDGTTTLYLGATSLIIGDASGRFGNLSLENTPVSNSKIRLEVDLDSSGAVISSNLAISR
jgi:RNA polymerase sigma factor (sigma-70 family)